jgi:hypothetical protein
MAWRRLGSSPNARRCSPMLTTIPGASKASHVPAPRRPRFGICRELWGYETGPYWECTGAYWPGHVGGFSSPEEEIAFLDGEAASATEYLEMVNRRISELEKETQEE